MEGKKKLTKYGVHKTIQEKACKVHCLQWHWKSKGELKDGITIYHTVPADCELAAVD